MKWLLRQFAILIFVVIAWQSIRRWERLTDGRRRLILSFVTRSNH